MVPGGSALDAARGLHSSAERRACHAIATPCYARATRRPRGRRIVGYLAARACAPELFAYIRCRTSMCVKQQTAFRVDIRAYAYQSSSGFV